MPLSDAKIRGLKPKEKPYKIFDFGGLYVEVRPTGSRLWRFKYRVEGKEKRLALGTYPEVSLHDARKARDAAKGLLAKGIDPAKAKQEKKQKEQAETEHTFAKLADAFLAKGEAEGRAPATLTKNVWLMNMAKTDFGRFPITEITAPMILATLRKVEAKGNYETAQRLRSKVSAVFRFAVASGIAEADPAHALRDALIRPTPVPRAAIVDPEELGGLLRAINGFEGQPTTRIALLLQALLAQRPGELRHAEWSEFDMCEAVWSVPARRMKMRRQHHVHLPEQAQALLVELREITGSGRYLFPSLRSFHRPISENTLNAALRRLGYSGDEMTAHGFRATFSTLANESGLWNPDAIERQLAHVERNAVRRAYARGEHWEERKRMMNWWAGFLDDLKTSSLIFKESRGAP